MPASFLSLNDDVLAVLVSYLSSQDARQLSYTTRAVHVVAAHRALQFVSLRSFSTVVRFCAYMLGKMQHRVFALRELRIHCTIARASEVDTASQTAETYAKGAASLVKMLEGAPRLRVFALDCAEYWMEYQTRLVDVLCTMTHLTEVDIQVVGPHAARFINNMEATPHKLILRPPRRRDRRAWPTETTDSRLNPELRLPSVKYLAATDCVNLPGANFLAQMFPSTRSLDIRYEGIDHGQPVELNWPTLEYVRARGHAFASWRNVSAIHLLELACKPQARIRDYQWPMVNRPSMAAEYVAAIAAVTNVQPVALIARLDSNLVIYFWTRFIRSSVRLRYLAVDLFDITSYDTCGAELASWWGKIHQVIETSDIICLEVRCPLRREEDLQLKAGATGAYEGSPSFEETVYHAFPASVRDAAPTLRYLSLDLGPGDESESPWRYDYLDPEHGRELKISPDLRWWRFEGPLSSRSVKVLDTTRGERIAVHLRSTHYDHSEPFSECDIS